MLGNEITLVPLPVSTLEAMQTARALDRLIAQSGFSSLTEKALDEILTADTSINPSPTERLRSLYKDAYTQEELKGLIHRTFQQFGIQE